MEKEDYKSTWDSIAETNAWPDPILLKNASPDRLPGFPYSRGGFRNRVTGKDADVWLRDKTFYVGRNLAARRCDLVTWLNGKTKHRHLEREAA